MGIPTTPQDEAAPAYDDVVSNHPVNLYTPSGLQSGYTTLPQSDPHYHSHPGTDIELHANTHPSSSHSHSRPQPQTEPQQPPESLTTTLTNLIRPRPDPPHTHCAVCDEQTQTAARHRRESERHCCVMVSATFIALFFCGMVLGIAIVNVGVRRREAAGGEN